MYRFNTYARNVYKWDKTVSINKKIMIRNEISMYIFFEIAEVNSANF